MAHTLRRWAQKNSLLNVLYNFPRLWKGYYPVFLDYPFDSKPRYGHGFPPHPELHALLARDAEQYLARLTGLMRFAPQLLQIPARAPESSPEPCWLNPWLSGLDLFALYGFLAERRPRRYFEIGSGVSTKVARRAIRDHKLATQIVSLDPHPRAEINALCDRVLRQPLQEADLSEILALDRGDMLFFDGSHRSLMNSDVTVFFLEILPRLRPGVVVHIHDIDLPWDYPPERAHWYYSEQYLLAVSLLAGHPNYRVLLPNAFVSREAATGIEAFWSQAQLAGVPRSGTSFWIETR
jgi:hypothetical protein